MASSTLNRAQRTAIIKLFREMAPICSICEANFTNWVEEHELIVEEDLSAKLLFVLPDCPYDIRRT